MIAMAAALAAIVVLVPMGGVVTVSDSASNWLSHLRTAVHMHPGSRPGPGAFFDLWEGSKDPNEADVLGCLPI